MTKRNVKPVPGFFALRDEFLQPFDQVFDQMMTNQFPTFFEEAGIDFAKGSYPKCNIIDDTDDVKIIAEIPGLSKSDVNITVEDGVLTISGTRTSSSNASAKYIRRELKHSSFKRSFTLSDTLDAINIAAKFENGILEISIPKKEESKPRTIEVNIA